MTKVFTPEITRKAQCYGDESNDGPTPAPPNFISKKEALKNDASDMHKKMNDKINWSRMLVPNLSE